MEEDTPGLRQSNSAPDLHVMLQQPMQSMPRMLLGPRQQPLGSSSAVGALVPYTATSTKVRSLCCCTCGFLVVSTTTCYGRQGCWLSRQMAAQHRCMMPPASQPLTSHPASRSYCALSQGGMLF
jgi:hypothetical protein